LLAACLHDWLLLDGWDRFTAAAAFFDGLRAAGVGRRRAFTLAVATIMWRWATL
jgi:putative heme degradation protein